MKLRDKPKNLILVYSNPNKSDNLKHLTTYWKTKTLKSKIVQKNCINV